MLRKFDYIASDKSLSTREVLVIQESDSEIVGIETKYLSEKEVAAAKKLLENFQHRPVGDKTPIEGYDAEWSKGWRRFKKANINIDPAKRLVACKDEIKKILEVYGFELTSNDGKVSITDPKSKKEELF